MIKFIRFFMLLTEGFIALLVVCMMILFGIMSVITIIRFIVGISSPWGLWL